MTTATGPVRDQVRRDHRGEEGDREKKRERASENFLLPKRSGIETETVNELHRIETKAFVQCRRSLCSKELLIA